MTTGTLDDDTDDSVGGKQGEYQLILQPSGRRGKIPAGTSIRTAARSLGVEIESICGENATCGKCLVTVEEGHFQRYDMVSRADHLSAPSDGEADFVARLRKGRKDKAVARLSCQARIHVDVLVNVPQASSGNRQIVRKGASTRPIALDPAIHNYHLVLDPPDLENPEADWERVARGLEQALTAIRGPEAKVPGWQDFEIDYRCLVTLSHTLRQAKWKVTVTVREDREVIRVQPGLVEANFGAAVDIGSTTLALYLCNLLTGEIVAQASEMNPQIVYGEDVVSRIQYAITEPDGLQTLHDTIIEALNKLVRKAARRAKIAPEDIAEMVLVGNSTMHHVLLNLHPRYLGVAPFVPAIHRSLDIKARDLKLAINPSGNIHVLPTIASFVGADTSALILAEEPHLQDETWLLIDIGTNGELVLGNRKGLVCTSTPTGPAMEGAHVEYGMRAAPGAIEHVRIDDATLEADYQVIGVEGWRSEQPDFDGQVRGICGSAIIDAVAELFRSGIVNSRGRFRPGLSSARLRKTDGSAEYVIAWAEETSIGRDIPITQNDVRQIQLAKAALFTAARTLLSRSGLDIPDRIVLAGGFGSFIDREKAMLLGMIPDCDPVRVTAVGNAAGDGARIALLNLGKRREIEAVIRAVERFELPTDPEFQNQFMLATSFPHMSEPFPHIAHLIPDRQTDPLAKNFQKKQ